MEGEIWVPVNIPGFESSHLVSNLGRVKTVSGKILSQSFAKDGYYKVELNHNGKAITRTVHRIVALSFLYDTYEEGLVVNHIDGIKTNNTVDNLEFVTIQRNTQHAYDMGLCDTGIDHHTSIQLELYDDYGNLISQYETLKDFTECTGINRTMYRKMIEEQIININQIYWIDYNKPVNLHLNKIYRMFNPIKLLDENYNTISLYTSASTLQQCTGIQRKILKNSIPGETYDCEINNKIYHIIKLTITEYLIEECSIINLNIEL